MQDYVHLNYFCMNKIEKKSDNKHRGCILLFILDRMVAAWQVFKSFTAAE